MTHVVASWNKHYWRKILSHFVTIELVYLRLVKFGGGWTHLRLSLLHHAIYLEEVLFGAFGAEIVSRLNQLMSHLLGGICTIAGCVYQHCVLVCILSNQLMILGIYSGYGQVRQNIALMQVLGQLLHALVDLSLSVTTVFGPAANVFSDFADECLIVTLKALRYILANFMHISHDQTLSLSLVRGYLLVAREIYEEMGD